MGNADQAGIIDHHFETQSAKSACELLVHHPELLLNHLEAVPASRIEFRLHHHPDLDCAATLYAAQELMDLSPRMEILHRLAEYVSLVDQAKIPDPEHMENSLYGVCQAHRLIVSETGDTQATDFKILEAQLRVVDAAVYLMQEFGQEAKFSSVFQHRPDWFAAEKEMIRRDLEQFREDLAQRSHTYAARVNGMAEPVIGLWIDHPRSIFFRIWAWSGMSETEGKGYGFLALNLGEPDKNRFVIGVDPASGTDLNGLGQLMEKHESEKRKTLGQERPVHPVRHPADNADPWYFGQGHNYKVIDSPGQGTVLTKEEVKQIHQKWNR